MTKDDVETMYWNHPIIKANQAVLDKTGTPMFRNDKEKEKSIAMFAVDNKFISRQEMYKLFGKIYREEVAE